MPAATGHYVFKEPSNPNIKIWRYMDFAKYVSLLDRSGLWFSRSDKLGDPFEGSISQANVRLRPEFYADLISEGWDVLEMEATLKEWYRQWTFINCWHMSEHESAAMWSLYARTKEALAIQSTYAQLQSCLPSNVFVGEVQYINYETDEMPEDNTFYPFVHKRESFEHERELRAVIQDLPVVKNPPESGRYFSAVDRSSYIPIGQSNPAMGRLVEVSIDDLLEGVYVAPTAPAWFRDLVEAVTGKYGFAHKPITRSSLDTDPVY